MSLGMLDRFIQSEQLIQLVGDDQYELIPYNIYDDQFKL
jgi:hypothetical protein